MTRTIALSLNNFATIPASLKNGLTTLKEVSLDTKNLFHHYFLAKYGESGHDTGTYEYERFLTGSTDWRFLKDGIGRDKEAKRNASNELGKGFARWFQYTHLAFTYFCPLEDLIGKVNSDGTMWTRAADGDLPDYVAGKNQSDVNLLEAKGRYTATGFNTKAFGEFREQIKRAKLVGRRDEPISVKGFISVARWATEHTPRVRSQLLVEDPWTEGRRLGPDENLPTGVGRAMVLGHYASVLEILRLPLQADALRARRPVPEQSLSRRIIWRCTSGSLAGRRFVGGILVDDRTRDSLPPWLFFDEDLRFMLRRRHQGAPLFLVPPWRFFGVEESVMRSVSSALRERRQGGELPVPEPVAVPDETGALSLLRDGTVLGPEDYFEPDGVMEI